MDSQEDPQHSQARADVPSNRRSRIKLVLVAGGATILLVLFLSLLLPALDASRRDSRLQVSQTQIRGIVQGQVTNIESNADRLPGIRKGYLIADVDGPHENMMPLTKHGGTVEGRFWLMLNKNLFSGEYIISPAESKTIWTTGELSSSNYSYALLSIHSDGNPLPNDRVRPDQIQRAGEWANPTNPKAPLASDRACIPSGRIGHNYGKIISVNTPDGSNYWGGNIGYADGSAAFEFDARTTTQYGNGPEIEDDRLFAREQDNAKDIDVLVDPAAAWDESANALLGYTSVGYDDGDIASE